MSRLTIPALAVEALSGSIAIQAQVNECVRIEDIDALHRMYVGVLRNLLGAQI